MTRCPAPQHPEICRLPDLARSRPKRYGNPKEGVCEGPKLARDARDSGLTRPFASSVEEPRCCPVS